MLLFFFSRSLLLHSERYEGENTPLRYRQLVWRKIYGSHSYLINCSQFRTTRWQKEKIEREPFVCYTEKWNIYASDKSWEPLREISFRTFVAENFREPTRRVKLPSCPKGIFIFRGSEGSNGSKKVNYQILNKNDPHFVMRIEISLLVYPSCLPIPSLARSLAHTRQHL